MKENETTLFKVKAWMKEHPYDTIPNYMSNWLISEVEQLEKFKLQNRTLWGILNGAGIGLYTEEEIVEQINQYAEIHVNLIKATTALLAISCADEPTGRHVSRSALIEIATNVIMEFNNEA